MAQVASILMMKLTKSAAAHRLFHERGRSEISQAGFPRRHAFHSRRADQRRAATGWRKLSAAAVVNDAVVSEGELMLVPRSMSDAQIHPTAIVDASAEIGAGTIVGPYCIVGPRRCPRRRMLAAASRHDLRAHRRVGARK